MNFYNALSVANFIIDRCSKMGEPISNLRLQKLLYFAWVDFYRRTRRPLFVDAMYAWQLGPVVPEVYHEYCVYGGRPINLQCESELDEKDGSILEEIIDEYRLVPVSELVRRSHEQDKAWYKIYDNGRGNRKVIPFELIKQMEIGG